MSHSHAKPVVKIIMTMKMAYSVIGTALGYFINIVHRAGLRFLLDLPLIHLKEICSFAVPSNLDATVSERTMALTTMAYLERRYAALEKEITDALRHRPTDDRAIDDLTYRKLIVADEIRHNRRLVERFGQRRAH